MYQSMFSDCIDKNMPSAGMVKVVRRPNFLTDRKMKSVFTIVCLDSIEKFWLENHIHSKVVANIRLLPIKV